ncbi:hypothetical protein GGF31_000142 [Allomyces arbusculus]|nr:hypothetical protein GGF31_000142 [Allomyces arbusculus]
MEGPQMVAPKPFRSNDIVLSHVWLVSETRFFYASTTLVFSIALFVYVSAILFALVLGATNAPRWVFFVLAGVAVTQMGNMLIINVTALPFPPLQIPINKFWMTLGDWVLELAGFWAFAWLNFYRFRAMCQSSRPRLVQLVAVLGLLQFGLWLGVAVSRCVAKLSPPTSGLQLYRPYYVSAAYILDAVSNCITSFAFIYHLHSLHPSPALASTFLAKWRHRPRSRSPSGASDMAIAAQQQHSGASHHSATAASTPVESGPVFYANMNRLLWRSQVLLFIECSFILSATFIQVVNSKIDPTWILMTFAQRHGTNAATARRATKGENRGSVARTHSGGNAASLGARRKSSAVTKTRAMAANSPAGTIERSGRDAVSSQNG